MQSTWNNQICINQVDIYIYFKNLLQDSIASHVKNLSVSAFLRLDGSIPGVVCEAAADEVRSFTLQYSSLPLLFFFFISFYYHTYHSCRFPMRKFSYGISCFSGTPFFLSVAVSVNWWRTISHRVIMKTINMCYFLLCRPLLRMNEALHLSYYVYGMDKQQCFFFIVFIENFIQHTFSSKKAIYRNSCRTLLLHWGFWKWKRSN